MQDDIHDLSSAALGEEARRHAEHGLSLIAAKTQQAFDLLDEMQDLGDGVKSARVAALTAGIGHNLAVFEFEQGQEVEGRMTVQMALDSLREGRGEPDRLGTTIEPLLIALAG